MTLLTMYRCWSEHYRVSDDWMMRCDDALQRCYRSETKMQDCRSGWAIYCISRNRRAFTIFSKLWSPPD